MNPIHATLIGRFGNQLFQYAHARALSEQRGVELSTPEWIGQKIFQINDPCNTGDVEIINGYHQHQDSLIYSRDDALRWFKFRPEILGQLAAACPKPFPLLAHRRVGDYSGAGFVVVSVESYLRAAEKFGLNPHNLFFITEESAMPAGNLPAFLPDFFRMMTCDVLLRGNSTFSWWAATLGTCRVFSPIIKGLPGGVRDCEFVEGNWPIMVDLHFNSDLHLK